MFSKLSRAITVAARAGGGDTDWNPRLRTFVDKAKAAEMPATNIEYAIKYGTGEIEGVEYEEVMYEAYAPGGVALLIGCVTDNSQRTVAEIRNILKKRDGSLGGSGSVTWMFEQMGVITVPRSETDEETLFLVAAEAGAEDVLAEDEELFEVRTAMADFHAVREALREEGITIERDELSMIPNMTVPVPDDEAGQLLGLLDALEEHDDVQQVFGNFELSDEALEAHYEE
jgi:YebC/PmpR family DNA-binding regulatory protein